MEVMNAAVFQRINPAGQAVAMPRTATVAPLSFAAGGAFSAAEFFATYISCANWGSMSAATKATTMAGYFNETAPNGVLRAQQDAWARLRAEQADPHTAVWAALTPGRPFVLG